MNNIKKFFRQDKFIKVLILILFIWFIWQSFKDEKLITVCIHTELNVFGQKKDLNIRIVGLTKKACRNRK